MKTQSKSMPKSINGQKNGQHHTGAAQTGANATERSIKFLKELNGQVVVSVNDFLKKTDLFLGKFGNNLRLKDGREVIVAVEIEDMYFPVECVLDLLQKCILQNCRIASRVHNPIVEAQACLDMARAYSIYCDIKDVLVPGHQKDTLKTLRQYDKNLSSQLGNKSVVEQLVDYSQKNCEDPENPKFCFKKESVDVEYLSSLIKSGYDLIQEFLEKTDLPTKTLIGYQYSLCVGGFLIAQLLGYRRREVVKYVKEEFGFGSVEDIKYMLGMFTIDKVA